MTIVASKIAFLIDGQDLGIAFYDDELSKGNLRVFVDNGQILELLNGE